MSKLRNMLLSKYKYLYAFLYIAVCSALIEKRVYAFQGSIYETGTKKLFKDVLIVGQGILAAVVIALYVIWEIQKRCSEDNEDTKYSKKQKGSIIGLIVGETIGIFIGIIGGYYGFKVE